MRKDAGAPRRIEGHIAFEPVGRCTRKAQLLGAHPLLKRYQRLKLSKVADVSKYDHAS
jgi:hypothetical protein